MTRKKYEYTMRPLHILLLQLANANTEIQTLPNLRNLTFPGATTTSVPSVSQILGQNKACQLLGQALEICNSVMPGFLTLQPTLQAQCLCYSSTAFAPGLFDGAVKFCADYASTAAPGAYGALSNLNNFCENARGPNSAFVAVTTGNGESLSSFHHYRPSTSEPTTFSVVTSGTTEAGTGTGIGSDSVSPWTTTNGRSTSGRISSFQPTDESTITRTFDVTIIVTPASATQTLKAQDSVRLRKFSKGDVITFGLAIAVILLFL
jgi:hypothetical protein